jgi:hypothetical protein
MHGATIKIKYVFVFTLYIFTKTGKITILKVVTLFLVPFQPLVYAEQLCLLVFRYPYRGIQFCNYLSGGKAHRQF